MEAPDFGIPYSYSEFARRILSVPERPMQIRQMRRHLVSMPPETLGSHLEKALFQSVRGDFDGKIIIEAFCGLVESADTQALIGLEALQLKARLRDYSGISWLLLSPKPQRVPAVPAHIANLSQAKGQTLGARRQAATAASVREIEKLIHDPHPMVVERLVANPRLQQIDVLKIASRRPNSAEVLSIISASEKWRPRLEVREAIVMNPYAATGLSLRLMTSLNIPIWQRVHHALDLHPALRIFARFLQDAQRSDDAQPGPWALQHTERWLPAQP